MSEAPLQLKKEGPELVESSLKSNKNLFSNLHQLKNLKARPTTAAESFISKPPLNIKKKPRNHTEVTSELLVKLLSKPRLALSNAVIPSNEADSKAKSPASLPRKPRFSPLISRPGTYNPALLLTVPLRKKQPRTHSLSKKSDDDIFQSYLPDFSIKEIIGKGAYATVRLAIQNSTKKSVAIKTYEKYQILDPQKKSNMLREIEILQKIDHVHIVKLFDHFETQKHYHLILEYIQGISLAAYLKSKPGHLLEENEARRIFKQVVSAIEYIHGLKIAHRDIKLDNILLDCKNNVKIIDFGFSTPNSNNEKSRVFCGTPSYMSPEIVGRKDYYGMQADVWALGILLYVMICGKMPFKAFNDKELYRRIEKGTFTVPSPISESLKNLLNKLLEVNPKKRPSAKEIIQNEWVSSSGILRSTTQCFTANRTNNLQSASLDLDIICGIVKVI